MKKETIFKYELNESMAANAAMKCLKNRNSHKVQEDYEEATDYTDDSIPSPNFSYQMSFMVWAMRNIIPYLQEKSQICAQADPTELKHAVMNLLKQGDRYEVPESPQSCKEWAAWHRQDVEEMLGGVAEQEEVTDDKYAIALKHVKKYKSRLPRLYGDKPEMFMMLKLDKTIGQNPMKLPREEYREWAKAICDACETVFGSKAQEQEELPQMERHDIILALAQYMSESWLETDDGDLDDIYYTISDIINETGDCPPSPSWEDCKDWCQKYYQDVETIIGIH